MPASEQRLGALDGLRGFAALVVLVSHFSNETSVFGNLLGNGAGKLGVLLFFVLSGFLMGWLYREQPFTLPNVAGFARRRFARIAPLFIAVLVLTYALYWTPLRPFAIAPINTRAFLETLFLWNGRGVLWTIPVEVQFYAVFPLVWLASARLPRLWLPLTALAAVILLAAFRVRFPVLLDYGAAFFIGVMLASSKAQPSVRVTNAIFAVSLVAFILLLPGIWRVAGLKPWNLFHSPLHMLAAGGLVWSAVRSPLAETVFGNRPARFLGDISFSLYLLHVSALKVLAATPVANNHAIYFVCFVALAIVVAALSNRFLEVPARRWLSGSSPRPASTAQPIPATPAE